MCNLLAILIQICCCDRVRRKKKRNRKSKQRSLSSRTLDTDWETVASKAPYLQKSQIPDYKFTQNVTKAGMSRESNEFEFDKQLLKDHNNWLISDTPLGKGGYGVVYKVSNTKTNDILAIKVMELLNRRNNETFNYRFLCFKNEIFVLRQNPHKNIIRLVEHFICNHRYSYIVMDFANSGNLNQRLKSDPKPFQELQSKTYLVQIANAIAYLHRNSIIHGDLKLENVLISESNGKEVLKITDFACSRVCYKDETGIVYSGRAVGTLKYMAPEMFKVYIAVNLNQPKLLQKPIIKYNPFRADMWALGVCLYKMLTQTYPFRSQSKTAESLLNLLIQMKIGFKISEHIFQKLSPDCIDLLICLLEYDKNLRIDSTVVLRHNWIKDSADVDKPNNKIMTQYIHK